MVAKRPQNSDVVERSRVQFFGLGQETVAVSGVTSTGPGVQNVRSLTLSQPLTQSTSDPLLRPKVAYLHHIFHLNWNLEAGSWGPPQTFLSEPPPFQL